MIGTVVVLATAALCVRLGFWQLARLSQRRAVNAATAAALAEPVHELQSVDLRIGAYRRVRAQGTYDLDRQVVVVTRPYRGSPGVIVLTPLRLDAGGAVLVQRGWVASGNAVDVDLALLHEVGRVEVRGVLLPPEPGARTVTGDTWPVLVQRIDARRLAGRYPYPIAPHVLRQLPDSSLPTRPRRMPLRPSDQGPHLSYAIQWFSFATILLVGLVAIFRAQRRQETGRPSSS